MEFGRIHTIRDGKYYVASKVTDAYFAAA